MNMKVTHSVCCGIGKVLDKIDDIKDKINEIFTGVTEDLPEDIEGVANDVGDVKSDVEDAIADIEDVPNSVKSELISSFNTVDTAISSAKSSIEEEVSNVKTTITSSISTAKTSITEHVTSTINTVSDSIDTATDTVTGTINTATTTVTNTIDTATTTVKNSIDTATTTIEESIQFAINDITDEIETTFDNWFTAFTKALDAIDNTFENVADDTESQINSLKSSFKSLGNVLGKTFDESEYAVSVFIKAILDSSSLPNDWIDALPDIIDIVEEAKDSLFGANFESIMGATDRRRNLLEIEAIIEWDAAGIDTQSMQWLNTGSLVDEEYNVDLSVYDDLVSANDIQCDSVCFNPETASDSDQCIRVDLDITENNYKSLTIDLYLYQRAISSEKNGGNIFSAGDKDERGIFMHHRSFDPDGFDQGIAIGTDSKWEGHEPLVDGTWNRVVAVWDGDTDTATLYVNDDTAITQEIGRLDNDREYFCLNAEPKDEDKNYWDGCIRRARIYDYALTADQIEETRDDGMLVDCTDAPTKTPSIEPSKSPTNVPSKSPTNNPTTAPTTSPTTAPTSPPSNAPSISPTSAPTGSPTTTSQGCVDAGNQMCSANEAVYTLGSNYNGYISNLLQVRDFNFKDTLLPQSVGWKTARELYTDGNLYIRFQTAWTVLSALKRYVDVANEVIAECITIDEAKCPASVYTVGIIGGMLETALWILEMFKDAADIHDDMLLTTQMDKVFKDQDVIINNQHMIYNKLEEIINDNAGAHHVEDNEDYDSNVEYFQIAKDLYNACYHIPKELVRISFVVVIFGSVLLILSIVFNVIFLCKLMAANNHYGKVQYE